MARAAKVIALHSFDDDEALMYLSDVGRVEMALSDLAQQFGWTLTKLRRSLSAWVKAGHITQATGGKGKVVVTSLRTSQQVANQLVKAIGCSYDEGMSIAWRVHNDGKAVVRIGPRAECERVARILAAIGLQVSVAEG